MKLTTPHNSGVARALRDALPIVVAYFPIAVTFGVLATSQGISRWVTCLISIVVYAGSAQFMMVSLVTAAASTTPLSFVLTILLVNLRHALYGTTLGPSTMHWSERHRLAAAFGLTDEVFAVTSSRDPNDPFAPSSHIAFTFICYLSWVAGTVCGASIGHIVPASVANVLSFALPSLFMALLFLGTITPAYLISAASGGAIAVVFTVFGFGSLAIIVAAVGGASVGFLFRKWARLAKARN